MEKIIDYYKLKGEFKRALKSLKTELYHRKNDLLDNTPYYGVLSIRVNGVRYWIDVDTIPTSTNSEYSYSQIIQPKKECLGDCTSRFVCHLELRDTNIENVVIDSFEKTLKQLATQEGWIIIKKNIFKRIWGYLLKFFKS